MGSYGIWMVVSSLISAVMTGGIVQILNVKANKRKANSEAKNSEALADGAELNNVEKAIKIWREMAESLKKELEEQRSKSDEMSLQLEALRKEIARLTRINSKIVEILNNMTADNFEKMVQKIKEEIEKQNEEITAKNMERG